jgi:hypothetical protein
MLVQILSWPNTFKKINLNNINIMLRCPLQSTNNFAIYLCRSATRHEGCEEDNQHEIKLQRLNCRAQRVTRTHTQRRKRPE